MKNAHLGDLEVSRIGLGAMTMAGTYTTEGAVDDAESIRTIHRALDLGVTHIDTAEIYGPFHSEEVVGRAVQGRRDEVVIATKFGLVGTTPAARPGTVDSSPANIRAAVEGSLQPPRHRPHRPVLPAPRRPGHADRGDRRRGRRADRRGQGPATSACPKPAPATIRRAHAVQPVAALQTEYSLWTRDVEDEILPLLRELGIGLVPYSPLGHGLLTGQIRTVDDFPDDDWRKTNPRFTGENFTRNLAIVDEVRPSAPRSAPPPRKPLSPGSCPG